MNKLMISPKGEYLDYIISFGQSNINGRNDPSLFNAKYIANNDLIRIFDIGINSLTSYFGNTLLAHYPQPNETANIAWDTLVYNEIVASLNIQLRIIKVTMGGSSCGLGWNVKNEGYLWLALKERVIAFQNYAKTQGKVARLRLMLCDLKESDADNEAYSLNYCYESGGILRGNFIDLVDAIKTIAGFKNVPIVHNQIMSTQDDLYKSNLITAQELFDQRYNGSYLLKMNDNISRYALQDQWHYNYIGTGHVASDNHNVIITNRLLDNWI